MSRKPQFLCYLTVRMNYYIGAFEAADEVEAEELADQYLARPEEQHAVQTAMWEALERSEIEVEEA